MRLCASRHTKRQIYLAFGMTFYLLLIEVTISLQAV